MERITYSVDNVFEMLYGGYDYELYLNDFIEGRTDKIEIENNIFLRKKYGGDVIKAYNEMKSSWEKISDDSPEKYNSYKKILEFIYENSLSDYVDPGINLRGKTTLEHLVGYFKNKKEQFTILDIGGGDGKIAIGLALCLKNIKKIYAVDECAFAEKCLKRNIDRLKENDKKYVKKKIVLSYGNFTDKKFLDEFLKIYGKVNSVIAANIGHNNDICDLFQLFNKVAFLNSSLLVSDQMCFSEECRQMAAYSPGFTDALANERISMINDFGEDYNLFFDLVDFTEFLPNNLQVTVEGKNMKK